MKVVTNMEPLQKRLITNDQQRAKVLNDFFSKLWVTIRGNGWLYVIQIKRLEVATHIPDSSIVLAQSRHTSGPREIGPDVGRIWSDTGCCMGWFVLYLKVYVPKKSMGTDGISVVLLKLVLMNLLQHSVLFFREFLLCGGKNCNYSGSQEKKKIVHLDLLH